MVIQFTLQALMIFLVCLLGIIAGILMIPTLWNVKKVVSIIRPLLENNQESIKKAVKTVPGIIENAGQISNNVRETTDNLKVSLPVIIKEVECVTHVAKESIELASVALENISSEINEGSNANSKETPSFMSYLHVIEEVIQIIYHTFSANK